MARNYPTASHQRILFKLTLLIGNHVGANQLGELLFVPFGVVLDDFDDVQPDLIFVSKTKQEIIQEEGVFGVPDLLVEIISPSSIRTDREKNSNATNEWALLNTGLSTSITAASKSISGRNQAMN